MRKLLLISASLLLTLSTLAQTPPARPVKWTFTVRQTGNGEAELVLTAKMENGYHVYSQDINPDVGPIPTSFVFNPGKTYSLDGKVTEGKAVEIYDPNFEAKLKYFSGEAVFVLYGGTKTGFRGAGESGERVCDGGAFRAAGAAAFGGSGGDGACFYEGAGGGRVD